MRLQSLVPLLFCSACASAPDGLSIPPLPTPTPAPAPPGNRNTLPVVPPPDYGMQVSIGPFDVPSGSEVQLCRTLKLANVDQAAVNRLEVVLNAGSHHFILFRSRDNKSFPDQIFPCWGTVNFDDWEFLMDVNRTGGYDWTLADGQGFMMQPNQQIMIQSHYVNATTIKSPNGGGGILNLYQVDPSQVVHQLYGMFTVDTRINIPPHSTYSTSRTCTFSNTVYIAAMTGHFHARGISFLVNRSRDGVMKEQIYESDNWDAPPFQLFDSSLRVFNDTDDGVTFTCNYRNDTDNPIGWGGHADVQEHCNLFFQYYDFCEPGKPCPHTPLTCAEGTGGW